MTIGPEHLRPRVEGDRHDLEVYLGHRIPPQLEEWYRRAVDPSTKVFPASKQYPVQPSRIYVVLAALGILKTFSVTLARATKLARAVGPDGAIALKIFDYPDTPGSDSDFNRELLRRSRTLWLPDSHFQSISDRIQYYDAIEICRVGVWSFEACEVPPPWVKRFLGLFYWTNRWQGQAPPGIAAYEIERYDANYLTRREMGRTGAASHEGRQAE